MNFIKIIYVIIFLTFNSALAQDKRILEIPEISQGSTISTKINNDIKFTSDKLTVDDVSDVMTASGNVIIVSKNRKIKADKVTYDKLQDKAIAIGNVVIIDKDGSMHESEKVILTDEFKSLLAIPLYSRLTDGSIVTAKELVKNNLGESVFKEGVYTACDCNIKEGETPIWRIESKKIRHDPLKRTIFHEDVKMKIFFIPIYYLPYMSQPDWTVRRRTGFLTPYYGYTKKDRFFIEVPFYYAPENDNSWDMTYTSHQKGKRGSADQFNYRKQYENTKIESNIFNGNLDTNKKDGDDVFGINLSISSTFENNWDMLLQGKYSDHDYFMRNYDFDNDSSYKSFIKLNKSKKNSISDIEFYNIESLEGGISSYNEPVMAPSISHHIFNGNDNYNYDIKINAHSVRNDEYYDINRWSGSTNINKLIRYQGFQIEGDTELGLDLYSIQRRPTSDTNDSQYIDRISTGASVAVSKEFVSINDYFNLSVEPKIQISSSLSPDRTDEIPNRDSSEFRLDEANLFLNNQYQGRDNIQENHKLNLGLSNLILTENYGDINVFFGQSQRIGGTNKNIKTTHKDRQSHIINSFDWSIIDGEEEKFNISWFALYNHHDFSEDLSDFTISGKISNGFSYKINHSAIESGFVENGLDKEELKLSFSKSFSNLTTSYSRRLDLNDGKQEIISETIGVQYTAGYMFQNCLTISFQYENAGEREEGLVLPKDSIKLIFEFRNLGSYDFKPKVPTKILDQVNIVNPFVAPFKIKESDKD